MVGTAKGKAEINKIRCNSSKNILQECSAGLGCTKEELLSQVLPVLQDLIYLRAMPGT